MNVKDRIAEHASHMFLSRGIRAVTMDDIAREMAVSKRTIYENYRDKEDLLKAVLNRMDQKYAEEVELIRQKAENTIILIFEMMKISISAISRINPLFFSDIKRHHYRVWMEVHSINLNKQKERTLEIIRQGTHEGLFRSEINQEIVSILLMEQLRIMHEKNVFPEEKFSRLEVIENVVVNFFRGIATDKGLSLINELLEREAELFQRNRPRA